MAICPISQTIINNSQHENDDFEVEYDVDEYESDEETNEYEPEEISYTRFNITVCELYNSAVYGPPAFKSLHAHYMVLHRFKQYDGGVINNIIYHYYTGSRPNYKHPIIRNYQHIHSKMVPEIAECIYLLTGECICIKKTIWIRLIQRTWKKIYKLRQETNARRLLPRNLFYRGITGSWSTECKYSHSIRGMLSALSRI